MSRIGGAGRIALSVALLLAALSLVAWRQSQAFETLASLDRLRREIDAARAERAELLRRADYLESRARVVPDAEERLGMHLPDASEIVYLVPETAEEPAGRGEETVQREATVAGETTITALRKADR